MSKPKVNRRVKMIKKTAMNANKLTTFVQNRGLQKNWYVLHFQYTVYNVKKCKTARAGKT